MNNFPSSNKSSWAVLAVFIFILQFSHYFRTLLSGSEALLYKCDGTSPKVAYINEFFEKIIQHVIC